MAARTVVGRGEKSLLSDPGSGLRLGRVKEKEKGEDNRWGMSTKQNCDDNTHVPLRACGYICLTPVNATED